MIYPQQLRLPSSSDKFVHRRQPVSRVHQSGPGSQGVDHSNGRFVLTQNLEDHAPQLFGCGSLRDLVLEILDSLYVIARSKGSRDTNGDLVPARVCLQKRRCLGLNTVRNARAQCFLKRLVGAQMTLRLK